MAPRLHLPFSVRRERGVGGSPMPATSDVSERSPIALPATETIQLMETSPLKSFYDEVEHIIRETPEGRRRLGEISDWFQDEVGGLQTVLYGLSEGDRKSPDGTTLHVSRNDFPDGTGAAGAGPLIDIVLSKTDPDGLRLAVVTFQDRITPDPDANDDTLDIIHHWRISAGREYGSNEGLFVLRTNSFYEVGNLPKSSGSVDALTTAKNLANEVRQTYN